MMRSARRFATLCTFGLVGGSATSALVGCGENGPEVDGDAIVVGAVLPFTGEDATIGENLERAMLLAIEDVNRAGGVNGRAIRLESGDSNSGSARGLNGLLELIYDAQVRYLVGPEENELADEIVPDIKGLDVFNVLSGFASPSIERIGRRGAWLRLPPSPLAFGCGLSELARQNDVGAANAIVAQDDFNQGVASEFITEFFDVGGTMLPSTTVRKGTPLGAERLSTVFGAGADRTLLIVNPTAASNIVTEWAVSGGGGDWILGPTLNTPGLFQNMPHRALDGAIGLSPTLSLASECQSQPEGFRGPVTCGSANAEAFGAYFEKRWDGERPFPAAHFYYDAVVLVAMGLTYAAAKGNPEPTASELHSLTLQMTNEASSQGKWEDLQSVMALLSEGTPVAYVGAAADYEFDRFGAAKHLIFDVWRVENQNYLDEGTLQARCLRQPK